MRERERESLKDASLRGLVTTMSRRCAHSYAHAGKMAGRDDRMRSSGVKMQFPLVHLAALQLHGDVLNAEQEHRIMNVL